MFDIIPLVYYLYSLKHIPQRMMSILGIESIENTELVGNLES